MEIRRFEFDIGPNVLGLIVLAVMATCFVMIWQGCNG